MTRLLVSLCVLCVLRGVVSAADPTNWQDVRPVLRKNCTVCHSERRLDELDVSAAVKLWDAADARPVATLWGGPGDDWLAVIPEGPVAGPDAVLTSGTWKAGGKPVADAAALAPVRDPAAVAKVLAGK